jgi:tRNA-dihydrouridine synthase A
MIAERNGFPKLKIRPCSVATLANPGVDITTVKNGNLLKNKLFVAPMMDWTDRHCRYFHRLCAPDAVLYTEMITAAALVHGNYRRLLRFNAAEHPVVLQLGGSDPDLLAQAAVRGAQAGYDEINLNVGCPSDRVQAGRFGACLMVEPDLVAQCILAMRAAVDLPVTVKTRLGVDDHDDYPFLVEFVKTVSDAGCQTFIIHARKAWLSGLSPRANREIPPLNYPRVRQLKADFPHLNIILNGGIGDQATVEQALEHLDGVMLGRSAYQDPYLLVELQHALAGRPVVKPTRSELVTAWLPYLSEQVAQGVRPRAVARALGGLLAGQPGARAWRRLLGELPDGSAAVRHIQDYLHAYDGADMTANRLSVDLDSTGDRQNVA